MGVSWDAGSLALLTEAPGGCWLALQNCKGWVGIPLLPSHFRAHPAGRVGRPGGLAPHLCVRGIYQPESSESCKTQTGYLPRDSTPATNSLTHGRAVRGLGSREVSGCGGGGGAMPALGRKLASASVGGEGSGLLPRTLHHEGPEKESPGSRA